ADLERRGRAIPDAALGSVRPDQRWLHAARRWPDVARFHGRFFPLYRSQRHARSVRLRDLGRASRVDHARPSYWEAVRFRERAVALEPGAPVVPENLVSDVLAVYPELLPVFLAFGFRPLANPLLRKTLARQVTVKAACRLLDVDIEQLLRALNRARKTRGGR